MHLALQSIRHPSSLVTLARDDAAAMRALELTLSNVDIATRALVLISQFDPFMTAEEKEQWSDAIMDEYLSVRRA